MTRYVAFLRGINSGRNPTVKMDLLRRAFEDLGFKNVKTIIASGNVIFEARSSTPRKLEQKIQRALPKTIGFVSETFVHALDDIEKLASKKPFKGVRLTGQKRAYVTFVKGDDTSLKFPVKGKGYTILGVHDGAVCSVVDISKTRTPDFMKVLDREWKENTTRGWNTIERILKK